MKAAVLHTRGADGLRVVDFPDPVRQPGEALMRVRAAALNRVDLYMRDNGSGITHTLPIIQGVEGAGEIVEAEAGSGLEPGMKVMLFSNAFCRRCRFCLAGDQTLCERPRIAGEHAHGCFAEYVSMPSYCYLPLPPDADLIGASTLLSAYNTSWRMLFGKRALRPGETVLVVGIGGGVAVACLQLARLAGAQVIVTSSSDEKIARAIAMGAAHGVNYRTEQVARRVLELTGGKGVDMVIDSSGHASWGDSLRSLRRGGRLITCGATTGSNPGADLQRMFIRQLEVYGSTGGSIDELREVLNLFNSGTLKPLIDRTFPLDDIRAAFDCLERGQQFGKLVVTMP